MFVIMIHLNTVTQNYYAIQYTVEQINSRLRNEKQCIVT